MQDTPMRIYRGLFIALVLFSSGCFTTMQPPVRPRGEILVGEERAAFLKELRDRRAKVKSARALLRAMVKQNEERYRYRYALAFTDPDFLRLDVLPLNNAFPLGVFAATEKRQVLLQVPEKKAIVSESYTNLLERVTGLPLPEKDFPWLVLGILPVTDEYDLTREDGKLVFLSKNKRYRAVMTEPDLQMTSLEIRDPFQEQLHAQITYEYGTDAGAMPRKLLLSFPRYEAEGNIRITSLTMNPELQESLFELLIPEDYSVIMK